MVITRNIFRGTHKGTFGGIPPTGNRIELCSIIIARIKNGKIIEEREEYDVLGMMQQLGMELKPIEAKKK
jgi:predicted ester cyclase